jgi:Cupin domain
MTTHHRSFDLASSFTHLGPAGDVSLVRVGRRGHPNVEGRLAGSARMSASPPHGGERHPDGDELLYLVEGAVDIALDLEGREEIVSLEPRRAFIVPRGVWHRVIFFRPAPFSFDLPVSCLAVHGNLAVIGAGPLWVGVIDNGSAGSPPDIFGVAVGPTDCSSELPPGPVLGGGSRVSGDIVVFDAPSKAHCLDGGWRNYTDAAGQPFTNQGRCIAFALGVA